MTQQPQPTDQPLDLAAIEARTNAATPGPWRADGSTVVGGGAWVADTCDVVDMAHGLADAEFVAHARTDVPALIAEVRRLTAERDQARAQLTLVDDEIAEFEAAAQDDPHTPAGVLLMIQILRRIRPAAARPARPTT